MLPFVFVDDSKLGPLHAYGIMCALGFFAWDWALLRQAQRSGGLDAREARSLSLFLYIGGFVFAWLVDAVFYHPAGQSVGATLASLQGFSSTGGIFGATVGAFLWRVLSVKRDGARLSVSRRATPMAMMPIADVIIGTWPLPHTLGRIGCALIHDHPGITVPKGTLASLFAVAWPRDATDGVHHVFGPIHVVTGGSDARFDLGLLEAILLLGLTIAFARTWNRKVRLGTYTAIGTLVYGGVRFFLDFLRLREGTGSDLRHGGLTFAQYFSLAAVCVGVGTVLWMRSQRREGEEPLEPAPEAPG